MEQNEDKTYKGVRRKRMMGGRYVFQAELYFKGRKIYVGSYKEAREAAKARDLYIIKHNIDMQTQILKKILA
jgi:hypothetical protein